MRRERKARERERGEKKWSYFHNRFLSGSLELSQDKRTRRGENNRLEDKRERERESATHTAKTAVSIQSAYQESE